MRDASVRSPRPARFPWMAIAFMPLALACGGKGSSSSPPPPPPPVTPPAGPAAPWAGAPVTVLTAVPGPARGVEGGVHVTLDGTASRTPAGLITSWSWVQTGGPAVTLADATTARPSFDAPLVDGTGALLTFELTVGDATLATASASHEVAVHEPTGEIPTSSIGILRKAIQAGSLDRDTAAQYLAFALFGDPRLPATYRGTTREDSGTWAMSVLSEEYPTLSPAAQAVVLPFLLPPGHPLAHATVQAGLRRARTATGALVPVEQRGVEGAHVAVWYWTDLANGGAIASSLVDEIEGVIWPKLLEVWKADHMPVVADAAVGAAFLGTHGKLNVFLDSIARDADLTTAFGYDQPYGTSAAPTPTYVVIRQNLAWTGKNPPGLIETAAHEITHACQFSFKHTEGYKGHRFLYEATATWAVDDVYPTGNSEQRRAPSVLEHPSLPLDSDSGTHPYGAYLFFQWVTRSMGDRDFVRRTFLNFEKEKPVDALDHAFPSYGGKTYGLEYNWGSFLEALWNRDPTKYFWAADDLQLGAWTAEPTQALSVGASGDNDFVMSADVSYLSSRYHHFTVDPGVRTIHFFDGLTFNLQHKTASDGTVVLVAGPITAEQIQGATTRMMVKRNGSWTAIGPTSASAGNLSFCQDDPDEEVQEIAIAFGDSFPKRGHSRKPLGVLPTLWVTNIGCFQWDGTVTAVTSPSRAGIDPQETITATGVIWAPYLKNGSLTFQVFSANVSWKMTGQVDNCSYAGSDAWTQGVGPTPTGMLVLAPTVLLGGVYRTYEGGASSGTRLVSYTATCTGSDGSTTVTTHQKPVQWLNTSRKADPTWRPRLSSDGALAADSADDGRMVYTWSFVTQAGIGTPP